MNRVSVAVFAWVLPIALGLGLVTPSRPAWGQFYPPGMAPDTSSGNIEGFTVVGKGSASALPNRLEVDVEVSAASELSADAIVKYRDAKERLQEAFEALKLENVGVEERGLLVDEKGLQQSPYYLGSQPNRRTRAEVQLTRKLVVTCSEIRGMDEEALLQLVAKLLDVAQDAGAQVGTPQDPYRYYYYGYDSSQPGLVRFVLEDFEALEDEAFAEAIEDARAQASRLAKLSKVELGPITGVRIAGSPDNNNANRRTTNDEPMEKRLESSKFQEIPVRVELMVRFDVAPRRPAEPARVESRPADGEGAQ